MKRIRPTFLFARQRRCEYCGEADDAIEPVRVHTQRGIYCCSYCRKDAERDCFQHLQDAGMMFVDDRLIPKPLRDNFIRLRHSLTGNVESGYRVFGLKSETDFPDFSWMMMMDADGWVFPVCRPEGLDEDYHRVSLNDIVALNPEIADILTEISEVIEMKLHGSNVYEDRFVRVV